jgi:hypothetical protein
MVLWSKYLLLCIDIPTAQQLLDFRRQIPGHFSGADVPERAQGESHDKGARVVEISAQC